MGTGNIYSFTITTKRLLERRKTNLVEAGNYRSDSILSASKSVNVYHKTNSGYKKVIKLDRATCHKA
jgi:hypothetical protein